MKILKTSLKTYFFRTYPLYYQIKYGNKVLVKRNLLCFKQLCDKFNVPFGLLYGTLLGAVREQDIIAHDGDTDLFMLQENWHTFSEILPEFLNAGFSLLQYNKNIITLFNNNEHIDIYFFSKYKDGIRKCNDFCLPEKFVTETVYISFLGEQFLVPKDYLLYLEFEYGQNWREPVVWDHLNPNPAMLFIKDALRRYFPFLHNLVKCCQGRKIRLIYIKKITQFRKIYKIEVAC